MSRAEHIDEGFVDLEFWALGKLLDHWASRGYRRITDEWKAKLLAFRKAVNRPDRGRDQWEREFVLDEFTVMLDVVNQIRRAYDDVANDVKALEALAQRIRDGRFTVECGAGSFRVQRPVPGPGSAVDWILDHLHDGRCTDESFAKGLVVARLQSTLSQIRDALDEKKTDMKAGKMVRREKRRTESTPLQQLAVSVLYDMSLSPDETVKPLRAELLTSLEGSGYPPICLYYLTQRIPTIEPVKRCPVFSRKQIQKLRNALSQR